MYSGKLRPDNTNRTATHRIVKSLSEPILDKGHHLYMDNFFSSPALFTKLAARSTGACGTLRINRVVVPATVKTADPATGTSVFHRDNHLLFVTWKDKRKINVLSTVRSSSTYTNRIRS